MSSSSGLGRPGPGQPEFDRPSDESRTANVPPARFGSPAGGPFPPGAPAPVGSPGPARSPGPAGPPAPWGPPGSGTPGAWSPPPGSQPPRRTGVRAALIVGTVVVAVALGLLAWQLLPATPAPVSTPTAQPASPAPIPATAPPSVQRTPASPEPTTSSQVTGGSIGQQIHYRTRGGDARVVVTRASWVDNGILAPDEGLMYLVVDVRFEGVSGTVTSGPFFTAVREPGGNRELMSVGAALDNQLTMKTLTAGQDNTGQVAFEVARGPVTFEVLDELLEPVARVEIPG
ncbi:MAG: hypothetical protein QM711_06480 [Micropruina sp.]|uniref:hypothetical protein n=1 Tax=Micropruina sp. TaxID=2737536 RepID=UPI0039E67787